MTVPGPAPEGRADLGDLSTEAVRPELGTLDLFDPADLVSLLTADPRRATEAVAAAAPSITAAVELVYQRLKAGGRLVYVGAGTAGRLAVLDAAELGPTFSVPEGAAEAIIAGGDNALRHAAEGAEDDPVAGAEAMAHLGVNERDVLIGVSASGRTPYVLGAVQQARFSGAGTVGLSCNRSTPLTAAAEVGIEVVVGGEVIAGSSRLNAGTAQKVVLNTISTSVMVLLGKTYGNLMVDVRATNTKLRHRAVRIVQAVTGVGPERAREALEAAGWDTKMACLVAATGKDVGSMRPVLVAAQGRLRQALAEAGTAPAEAGGEAKSWLTRHSWSRLGVGAALVDGALVPGDVAVHEGIVVAVGLPGKGSGVAAPGLVDLQVNGYGGVDAANATVDDLELMSVALARDGVLAFQPTLISGDPELTSAAVARITEAAQRQQGPGTGRPGACILGAHLEGPFLSPGRAGTHPVHWLRRPDLELARTLLAAGHVTMVTLAPELPGAIELISWLAQRGVVVSLGHSAATSEQAAEAVSAGASVVTHLYNGMSPLSARAPGLAGLALSDRRVRLQLIADGGHVADELVRLTFAAAADRCSIVTDATSLTEAGAGQLMLGDVPIVVQDGVARNPDGTIAGGTSTLLDGLRHLGALSVGLVDVLAAATERPARVLGRDDVGYLRLGGPANIVVLDDRLELRDVVLGGRSAGDRWSSTVARSVGSKAGPLTRPGRPGAQR